VSEKPCSIQEDGLIILAHLDSGRHHLHDVQPNRNSKRAFWNITIAWISRIANLYNPTTPTSLQNQDRKMQDQGDDKYAIHAAAREGKSESVVKDCCLMLNLLLTHSVAVVESLLHVRFIHPIHDYFQSTNQARPTQSSPSSKTTMAGCQFTGPYHTTTPRLSAS
jgi:hypothetical protein